MHFSPIFIQQRNFKLKHIKSWCSKINNKFHLNINREINGTHASLSKEKNPYNVMLRRKFLAKCSNRNEEIFCSVRSFILPIKFSFLYLFFFICSLNFEKQWKHFYLNLWMDSLFCISWNKFFPKIIQAEEAVIWYPLVEVLIRRKTKNLSKFDFDNFERREEILRKRLNLTLS